MIGFGFAPRAVIPFLLQADLQNVFFLRQIRLDIKISRLDAHQIIEIL